MSAAVALRRAILRVARTVDAFTVIGNSRWRAQRLLILGYHGISIDDEHLWNPSLYMPQPLFRQRMEILRREGCSVLPLDEAVHRLYSGDLPPKSVALTFDDGARDFRLRAFPVLQEFGYPAVVYLTTYYSVNRHPVFNVFYRYLLWKCSQRGADPSSALARIIGEPVPAASDPDAVADLLVKWLRTQHPDYERKHEVGRLIATSAGLDYENLLASGMFQLMGPEEVRDVADRGACVQLHTHRHRTPNDEALFKRELRENRKYIVTFAAAQVEPVHFCYPNGNHFPELYPWLDDEGIGTATTCQCGLAEKSSYRLALPRLIDTCSISALDFLGWVSGASHMLHSGYKREGQNRVRRNAA